MSTSNQEQQSQNQPEPFTAKTIITLQAADGDKFNVIDTIAKEMGTIRSFLDANEEEPFSGQVSDGPHKFITVPLVNVSSSCLVKIIKYCKTHLLYKDGRLKEEEINAFDSALVKDESDDMIKELLLSANYLDVKDLLEMLEKTIADRIKNKSPEYVRKLFGIDCDFSPEQEAKFRQDNNFAFEGIDRD